MSKRKSGSRDPMARDLRTPKYRPQTISLRNKDTKNGRKAKHKGKPYDAQPLAA